MQHVNEHNIIDQDQTPSLCRITLRADQAKEFFGINLNLPNLPMEVATAQVLPQHVDVLIEWLKANRNRGIIIGVTPEFIPWKDVQEKL